MIKNKYLNWYLVGFTDAEGCFSISLKREKTTKFGWALDPVFQITQHKSNEKVLHFFKRQLHCGRITEKSGQPNILVYLVDNRRQLVEKVIPFFKRYKLILKNNDFQKFTEIITDLENKLHSNKKTFIELIKKCFEMNLNGKQRKYELEFVLKNLKK